MYIPKISSTSLLSSVHSLYNSLYTQENANYVFKNSSLFVRSSIYVHVTKASGMSNFESKIFIASRFITMTLILICTETSSMIIQSILVSVMKTKQHCTPVISSFRLFSLSLSSNFLCFILNCNCNVNCLWELINSRVAKPVRVFVVDFCCGVSTSVVLGLRTVRRLSWRTSEPHDPVNPQRPIGLSLYPVSANPIGPP